MFGSLMDFFKKTYKGELDLLMPFLACNKKEKSFALNAELSCFCLSKEEGRTKSNFCRCFSLSYCVSVDPTCPFKENDFWTASAIFNTFFSFFLMKATIFPIESFSGSRENVIMHPPQKTMLQRIPDLHLSLLVLYPVGAASCDIMLPSILVFCSCFAVDSTSVPASSWLNAKPMQYPILISVALGILFRATCVGVNEGKQPWTVYTVFGLNTVGALTLYSTAFAFIPAT